MMDTADLECSPEFLIVMGFQLNVAIKYSTVSMFYADNVFSRW